MVLKTLFPKNTGTLIYDRLYAKKNWLLISIAILLITVVLLPILIIGKIREENIIIGIVEIFIIVFINCIISFNYFHDSRKLSYYVSKPITNIQKVNISIITNIIFTAVLLGILLIIINFSVLEFEILEIFIVIIPWLLVGILVAALSCILTGNSIIAGISTIINFTLPLSFLTIIMYMFKIVEDIAVGFNADILLNNFMDKYYRLDYLYFLRYFENGISISYFVILIILIVFVYSLIYLLLKRRQNERAGDFIVYDGYKNLISVLVASLVPIGFLIIIDSGDFISKIISFFVLSALTYYIIVAILEKSFRVSKSALKLFAVFMVVFLLFIAGANIATNSFENYVPNINDVKSVYLGDSTIAYSKHLRKGVHVYDIDEDFINEAKDISIYTEKENIESIINLHKELINNRNFDNYSTLVISYYLKNGKIVTRYYELENSESYNGKKDNIIKLLVNSKEFKEKIFGFIYDDEYVNNFGIRKITFNINGSEFRGNFELDKDEIDLERFRNTLKKDYDNYFNSNNNYLELAYRRDYVTRYIEKRVMSSVEEVETEEIVTYRIVIENYNQGSEYFTINNSFVNTVEYIEELISEKQE